VNEKLAKKARRAARAMTVGMPDVKYKTLPNSHIGTRVVLPECTRGVYLAIKRATRT